MKKATLIILLLSTITQAQNVNIPDANFKNALLNHNTVIDTNDDGDISIVEAEAFPGMIDVANKNISDLTGIQAFVNLTILVCYNNQLTSLDVSKNVLLEQLWCSLNQLTTLEVSKNKALYKVSCSNNQLKSLDVSGATALNTLYCWDNQLTSLDVINNVDLESLGYNNNQLTTIDISHNTKLHSLGCLNNLLTSLDVSNNTALGLLECSDNQLTSLDVSKNTALESLSCSNNNLTILDVSKNTALNWLLCYNNQLTSLDISNGNNSNLRYLNFQNNPDLSCVNVDNQTQSRNWQKQQEIWYTEDETNITYYTFDWDDHVVFSEDCSALSNQDITNTTLKVYPNPANNFITIDSTLEGNYNLVSILGKTVGKGNLNVGENILDISTLDKGIYFVNISSNNTANTLKIVKE